MGNPSPGARFDLEPALVALPLFPLPTVLFPGALMPLHVFESRYRAMVRDALASHGALAVVLVTDAAKVDAHGHPQIAKMAGVGLIVDHTELPNGRYNVLVEGLARVELTELPFEPPYRRASARIVVPKAAAVSDADSAGLLAAVAAFTAFVRKREPSFAFSLPRDASTQAATDLAAHHLILDARERQAILETLDPGARARRTAQALVVQRLALTESSRELN